MGGGFTTSVTYSLHAAKRMLMRGISRADVDATLRQPDVTLPEADGKRRAIRTTSEGVKITVIYAEPVKTPTGNSAHVITVW